ncbi:MAG: glycosyltransferase family 2 protein [Burkholderiales bacterium]|nr:MAG: glycosyltransferase family 2 protein [Burkholderiales bacterium]
MAVVFHPGLNAPAEPRVSVCIANFNGEALLPACLDSVLAQETDAAIEILLHDDASGDGSLALLQRHYPQVHVLASGENVGFCVGNNRMVSHARGEYVLLLNNDAALAPDATRTLLAAAEAASGPTILTLPQYDWESGQLVDRGCLLDPFYNPVPNLDPERLDVAYVIGACLWIPRYLWNELGGFPAWFGSLAEDMLLCSAARLHGVPVRCIDGSAYRHRQGASFGGNRIDGALRTTYRRRAMSERNKTWVMLACTPGLIAWPLLALHLVMLYAEGALVSLARRDARLWREVYRPVLPSLLASRADWRPLRERLQAGRCVAQRRWWQAFTWIPRKLSLLWRHGLPHLR